MRHQVIGDRLAEHFGKDRADVIQGKGGFWLKGDRFYTLREARRLTGIPAPKRAYRDVIGPWGDWATVAAINGVNLKGNR